MPSNYSYSAAIHLCGQWPYQWTIGIYTPPKPWVSSQGTKSNYPNTQIPVNELDEKSCEVGNPCFVGSGIEQQQETDFVGVGSQPLTLKRGYRSSYLVAPADGFGALWMHEWQRRLDLSRYYNTTPSLASLRDDRRWTTFALNNGVWAGTDGRGDQIVAVTDAGGAGQGFRLADRRNDRTEDYDTTGKLTLVKERNGRTTSLKYSDTNTAVTVAPYANLLIEVSNQFGQTIRFTYDSLGRINAANLPNGTVVQYGYDAYGMLNVVTYADNTQRKYHYENTQYRWAMTGITDEKGVRFATYAYDSLGRATSTEHAGGVDKFQLSFLGNGQTSVTTADGTSRTFTSELQGNVLRATGASARCPACGDIAKAVTYDAAGNVASKRDFADKESRYSYDALGRETQRIEGYGTADAKTTTTEWHPTWNLPLKIAEPGRFEYFSYDASGQLIGYVRYDTTDPTGSQGVNVTLGGPITSTGWTYESNGLKSATIEMVDGTVVGQWTYTYDAQGQLQTITDLAGRTARAIQYDAAGRLIEGISLDSEQLRYQYTARGDLATYDVNGRVLTYEYDLNGFLTAIRGGNGYYNGYVYDAAHRLTGVLETPLPISVSDTSSPFRTLATSDQASATSSETTGGRWRAAWSRIFQWLTSWISRAHAQVVLPVLRPIPVWPSMSQAPSRAPSAEDELMGITENPNAILSTVGRTLRELANRVTEPMSCDEDPRCTKARRDAQAAHHDLTTKRWGQYMSGGTNGSDPRHRKSVIEKQSRLRDAIRRVKLYCVAWPLELPEWEYQANRDVPILY